MALAATIGMTVMGVVMIEMALGNSPSAMHVPPLPAGLEEPVSELTQLVRQVVVDQQKRDTCIRKLSRGLAKHLMQRNGDFEVDHHCTWLCGVDCYSLVGRGWFKCERETKLKDEPIQALPQDVTVLWWIMELGHSPIGGSGSNARVSAEVIAVDPLAS